MNHIIWKGTDSRDIKGLLICELPPISKPQMRVIETSIDGVDGSIIEEVGYSSYDKALIIGITQNADIDEISQYFNGSGEVVFSNEADKYYKAHIINQIDYARLVRFKVATVVFRVQPFKYEYLEEKGGTRLNVAGGKNLFKADAPTQTISATISYENAILELTSTATDTKCTAIYNFEVREGDIVRFNAVLLDKKCQVVMQKYTTLYETLVDCTLHYKDGEKVSSAEYKVESGITKMRLVLYADFDVPKGVSVSRYQNCILTINNEDTTYKEYEEAEEKSIKVKNAGNYMAKPITRITGTGEIELRVNGNALFSYTFPANETEVVIDSQKQDAYLGTVLKNRNMVGEFPTLEKGENIITWDGSITNIEITSKSRWL